MSNPRLPSVAWIPREPSKAVLVERDEEIVFVSNSYAAMLGYESAEALVGEHVSKVIAKADIERMMAYGRQRLMGEPAPGHYIFEAQRRDGAPQTVAAEVAVRHDGGKHFIETQIEVASARYARGVPLTEESFGETYDRYSSSIYGLAFRVAGDESSARAVLLATFREAWNERDRRPEFASDEAWLGNIARRHALIATTRQAPLRLVQNPERSADGAEPVSLSRGRLQFALAALSGTQRQMIELWHLHGCDINRISDRLQMPVSVAREQMTAALRKLRSVIQPSSEVDPGNRRTAPGR